MRLSSVLLLCACAGGSPTDTDVEATPDRYPRCEAAPDDPIIPKLVDLLAWRGKVADLSAQAHDAAAALPSTVPAPPAPTGKQIVDLVSELISEGPRTTGSPAARHALDLALSRAEAAGAEVHRSSRTIRSWSSDRATLTLGGSDIPAESVIYTAGGEASGQALYVGEGAAVDLEAMELSGRILVAELTNIEDVPDLDNPFLYGWYDPDDQLVDHPGSRLPGMRGNFPGRFYQGIVPWQAIPDDIVQNAIDGGAAGLVLLLRDHAAADAVPIGPYDGISKDLPVLLVARGEAEAVRQAAIDEAAAHIAVEAETTDLEVEDGWAVLPGSRSDVLLFAVHVDGPFGGVAEDGLAVAHVIAQLEAWAALPVADRPYTLAAVFVDGHFAGADGTRAFLAAHPAIAQRAQVVLTVDGLGAAEGRWSEEAGAFELTGHPDRSSMMVGHELPLLTAVYAALQAAPPPSTRLFTTAVYLPASEAGGAVVQTSGAQPDRALRVDCGAPFISWGTAPPWHLDRYDTVDKLHSEGAGRYAASLTALVSRLMVTEPWVSERQ